jgi:hypothetical protein
MWKVCLSLSLSLCVCVCLNIISKSLALFWGRGFFFLVKKRLDDGERGKTRKVWQGEKGARGRENVANTVLCLPCMLWFLTRQLACRSATQGFACISNWTLAFQALSASLQICTPSGYSDTAPVQNPLNGDLGHEQIRLCTFITNKKATSKSQDAILANHY